MIGVTPRGFTGVDLSGVDVWLPMRAASVEPDFNSWFTSRGWYWVRAIARLRSNVSVAAAEAEATQLHRAGRAERIEAGGYDPEVQVIAAPLIVARGPLASNASAVSPLDE